jgi:GNAT superfamily N-acetyltransferase
MLSAVTAEASLQSVKTRRITGSTWRSYGCLAGNGMQNAGSSANRLFSIGDTTVVELHEADIPTLQKFFGINPEYFLAVHGEPPRPDEAMREFFDRPPLEMSHDKIFLVAFIDTHGSVVAIASIISNLLARHVWHISLFMVATAMHGTGIAHVLYAALERWLVEQGARWIRLGVVDTNSRAKRFWIKHGYIEVRRRHNVQLGQRTHVVGVCVKPLNAHSLTDYLSVVVRDRPESTLP